MVGSFLNHAATASHAAVLLPVTATVTTAACAQQGCGCVCACVCAAGGDACEATWPPAYGAVAGAGITWHTVSDVVQLLVTVGVRVVEAVLLSRCWPSTAARCRLQHSPCVDKLWAHMSVCVIHPHRLQGCVLQLHKPTTPGRGCQASGSAATVCCAWR